MLKTPEEIAAEEAANKEQREQLAREANEKRNTAMLEARNRIADQADRVKDEEDDLIDMTDEMAEELDRPGEGRRKTREELIAEQDASEEDAVKAAESQEDELDEARDAGADDSRKNAKGVVEYRVEVAGKEKWLTLSQLRAHAGQVTDDSDSGTTRQPQGPTPEQIEERRQAAERERTEQRQARKAKLIDLHTRASMGDEEAISELADIQADSGRVTPEEIERMVDSRVAAQVRGTTAFDQAVKWFESKEGYAKELSAPGFKQLAGEIDVRLVKEQPNLAPKERLKLVGEELRTKLTDMAKFFGARVGDDTGTRTASRLERKRQASDEVPRAAGRARPAVEMDEAETTQDAIQSLARARGQARPISHKH